jgi:hypothetical protein
MSRCVILFACLLLMHPVFSQSNNRLLNLSYGKYKVGLFQNNIRYSDSVELLVNIWQPVEENSAVKKYTIRDYIAIELPGILTSDGFANELICGNNYTINPDSLSGFLSIQTSTYKEGKLLNKKFPVLVWASRHGTTHYQLAMCEYLASHGYIVFNAMRLKPGLPLPWEVDIKERIPLLHRHLDDMNALIGFIKTYPQADTLSMALLSWSYGASAAIFTQQSHPEIDVVIGLSSINFKNDFFTGPQFDKMIEPKKLKTPYILFYESVSRLGNTFTDSVLHPAHKNISLLCRFPKMFHGNFNYLEGHVAGKLKLPIAHPWTKPGVDAVTGYETVSYMTLLTLNRYLKFADAGKTELLIKKLKKKLPRGFIE